MTEPGFSVILSDLLDGVLGAIAEAIGAAVGAIGEIVLIICEAIFGSDRWIAAIPVGLCASLAVAFGVGYAVAGGEQAWISATTIWIAGALSVFLVIAILVAGQRRRRP